jgi:hypothetical protein
MKDRTSSRADTSDARTGERGTARRDKAEKLEAERQTEREDGIAAARRGGPAAPSDQPENEPPHPQDVNEIGEPT